MDFWDQHSIMFVMGLIFWPRISLLYFGFIPPADISSILGFLLVPRMFFTGTLTAIYWETNSLLIVICWILAIIIDCIGLVVKATMQKIMKDSLREAFKK